MKRVAVTNAIIPQFHGRRAVWVIAFIASSTTVAAWFYAFRPTCDLLFDRSAVALEYCIAWICLFALIGMTVRAKLVFLGILVFLWLVSNTSHVDYRVPLNEHRAIRRIWDIQSKLRTANAPINELSDIVGSELGTTGQMVGYQFKYLPELQAGDVKHYVITARPLCYCWTGQRSFRLDDSGTIHYTLEDRAATIQDPVVKRD